VGMGLALVGCRQQQPPPAAPLDYAAQLPAGALALREIPPEQWPDFSILPEDLKRLRPAIAYSLEYLAKPSSQAFYPYGDITHDRAVATLQALDAIAASMPADASRDWLPEQIRQKFNVYMSVGAPEASGGGYTGKVLFTGYYTPIYAASFTRGGAYQWPLYKRPADLVADVNSGKVAGRRMGDGSIVPYFTRGQIESGALAGDELIWLTSRWQAYVVTVQGSGRLRTPDGQIVDVGYAGNNGYDYSAISARMKADGVLPTDQPVSLKEMGDYFDAHSEAMDKYLALNQRTVFFAVRPGGPYGKLNEPVTPLGTIATDKETHDIYPRAMPAFLVVPISTPTDGLRPFRGFMLDQDTGGAIRASGRCDIYFCVGSHAGELAGQEVAEGALYYLAIRQDLMPATTAPTSGAATEP